MKQQTPSKVFLLNGPPYCGKDSLANYMIHIDRNNFIKGSLATPLKEANRGFFSLTEEEFNRFDSIKEFKEMPMDMFFGKSWRQVNIDLAEIYVKKHYGDDAFGRLLVERLKRFVPAGKHVVISDCGFDGEVVPLIEHFGKENVYVIKIKRKGSEYKGDSRGYINAEKLGIAQFHIENKVLNDYVNNGANLIRSIIIGQKPQTKPFSEKVADSGEIQQAKSTA